MKEINEDLHKWRAIPCSRLENFTVKMSVLPRLIYRFNIIPIKLPLDFFVNGDKLILKATAKVKAIRIAKVILKKNTEGSQYLI